jgi:hypothetical protein
MLSNIFKVSILIELIKAKDKEQVQITKKFWGLGKKKIRFSILFSSHIHPSPVLACRSYKLTCAAPGQ